MPSPDQTVMQNGLGSLKPYACAVGVDDMHIVVEAGCAPSACYDYILKFGHLQQHAMLKVAKALFAKACEYVAYIGHEPALDIVVEIDELEAGIFGQSTAKSGFAAPHVA